LGIALYLLWLRLLFRVLLNVVSGVIGFLGFWACSCFVLGFFVSEGHRKRWKQSEHKETGRKHKEAAETSRNLKKRAERNRDKQNQTETTEQGLNSCPFHFSTICPSYLNKEQRTQKQEGILYIFFQGYKI
jgi:hypothetical protein